MDNYLYDVARRLIAFDTVSSKSNRPAIDYLAGELEPLGFHVAIQTAELLGVPQANLIAWIGPEQRTGLIISGHVDTVPFEGQPGWTCDPLKLTVQDDRLYGRGTSDMKGFIAQCLAAARGLNTATLKRPLVFLFTASEEVGCLGAARAATELSQTLGETPMPHLAWIGEPTSYAICHAHKSIVSFEIIVRGIGGHSGAPARGVNAIAVMARAIEAVGQLQEERRSAAHPEFSAIFPDAPTDVLNFGTINGGLAANIIAEECRLRISYRSMPDADPMALYREISERIAAVDLHDFASRDRSASIKVGPPAVVPPLNSPRGTALERALFDATGAKSTGGAVFATDGGQLSSAGIASLICGPGDLDQAHQPNESIRRDAFESGTAKILRVVDALCCVQ